MYKRQEYLDADVQALEGRELLEDAAEVERYEGAGRRVGLHADRAAGIDNQDRRFHIDSVGLEWSFVVCRAASKPNIRRALRVVAAATSSGVVPFSAAILIGATGMDFSNKSKFAIITSK